MPRKNSYITATDQFCGAGGSTSGAKAAGVEVRLALNHWKLAIETHNTNHPTTDHDCTDIQACDPRRYPSTDILITSPECTNHSLAKGKTRKMQEQADLFGTQRIDPAAERSRATMWDVVRFAEYHNYNAIITENVVDARYWRLWDAWILAMHNLGYAHKCVYMNSMFHYPTPQSRDRMYVVFWKRGNKAPYLEFSPAAHCPDCGRDVEARQHWKPGRNFGKYKTQYIYRCPDCHREVSPYYYAAFNAIDWTIPSVRIGDRPKPLSPNTLTRIQAGLDKYSGNVFVSTSSYDQPDRSIAEAMTTQTGQQNKSIVIPMVIQTEHSQVQGLVRPSHYPIFTQTTRQSMGIVIPMLVGNYSPGWVRDTMQPSGTVTCSDHHGLLTAPVIVENFGEGTARSAMDRMGCITAGGINYGILTSKSMSAFLAAYYSGSNTLAPIAGQSPTITTVERLALVEPQDSVRIEDCHYRMLVSKEVQACMAFPENYIVLGSSKDQVRQLGNAVTPPAMEFLTRRVVESLN